MIQDHLKAIAKAAAKVNNDWRNTHPNAPLARKARLDELGGAPRWSGFLQFPEENDLTAQYAKMGRDVVAAFEAFAEQLPRSARPLTIELDLDDYNGDNGAITKVAMNYSLAGMQVARMVLGFEEYQDYGADHLTRWINLHEKLDVMDDGTEPESDWLVVKGGGENIGQHEGRFQVTRLKACGEREAALKALAISRGPRYIIDALEDSNHSALSAEMQDMVISRVTDRTATQILEQEFPHEAMEVEGP